MRNKIIIGVLIVVIAIIVIYILLNNNLSNSNEDALKPKEISIKEKYNDEEALSSWGLINIKKMDLNGNEISNTNDKIYGIVMYQSYIDICLNMNCSQYEYTLENDILKINKSDEFKDDYLVSYDENKNMIWTVTNPDSKIIYYFAMPAG